MHLSCPQCNQPVSAADINIQQLVAICTSCDNVFSFSSDLPKSKRRKAGQPEYLDLNEADDLRISFRSNFRLDKNENFISSAIMTIVFASIALLMIGLRVEENIPVILPIAFALSAAFAAYWVALIAYNKTHIVMDPSKIRVSRGPLPSYGQEREIELNNVVSIFSEETTASQKEGYDTPRYHVWAKLVDNRRKLIVADVTDDYGLFIAQRLQEYLDDDKESDWKHLSLADEPDAVVELEKESEDLRFADSEGA